MFILFLQQWLLWMSESAQDWMPRSVCVNHNPMIIGLHIVADFLIALAYYSIPLILWYIARKQKMFVKEYRQLFILFGLFILLCGTTHLIGIIMFWYPMYWADGAVKLITGLVSLFTAIVLFKFLPKIMVLPTKSEFEEADRKRKIAEIRVLALEGIIKEWTGYTDLQIKELRRQHLNMSKAMERKND